MVWVSTNNHGHTAEQVTGGIKAIVQLVNQWQPQAWVVLVRSALVGHPRAHFLDADPGFVHLDGTISHHDVQLPASKPLGLHACLSGPTLPASASAGPRPRPGSSLARGHTLSIHLSATLNSRSSVKKKKL
ncbi:hypothetical protein HPG69_009748 [Diceros bicornis minor]|uniref:Uncharacterized protein n=1 Tax=Diceros bicornis minor TaxID=77932 RepID=A0A7J7EY61_DICBM|nr:hypothetical protein HPG69_009748 [Diceros bicornis minor]